MEPWGGVNLTGSQTVTLTTTNGTSIPFSVDGSYPTIAGPIYNGPLSVSLSNPVVVQARGYDSTTKQYSTDLAAGHFRGYGFKAGDQWYSSNDYGNPVSAMSGSPVFENGRYYMAGQFYMGGINSNVPLPKFIGGVRLYSSPDFYNWNFESIILNNPPGVALVTRPKILHNAGTGQYVLWAGCYSSLDTQNAQNGACIATASAITGPWAWESILINPDGRGYKDSNVFQDDDGTAYTTYTGGGQAGIYVSKLAGDYRTTSGQWTLACTCDQQESPVLFKRNGVYFLIHGNSNLTNYQSSMNPQYHTASSPLGSWSAAAALYASDPVGTFFNSQPSAVFKVQGTTDGWVLLGDLWIPEPRATDTTHVLVPLSFADSTHVQAQTPAVWDLSTLH
jgi:hypothetical protein